MWELRALLLVERKQETRKEKMENELKAIWYLGLHHRAEGEVNQTRTALGWSRSPRMRGREVLNRVKKDPWIRPVPNERKKWEKSRQRGSSNGRANLCFLGCGRKVEEDGEGGELEYKEQY